MTESRSAAPRQWSDALWAWRDFVRGSDPNRGRRRPDLAGHRDLVLATCEEELLSVVNTGPWDDRARRCMTGFFGIGESPADHSELARENNMSVSSIEKILRRSIDLMATTAAPPPIFSSAPPQGRIAASPTHFCFSTSPLQGLLTSWGRLRPDRKESLVLGAGLAWWHAEIAPYSTVLSAATVKFRYGKQAQRAKYAAFNLLRIDVARKRDPLKLGWSQIAIESHPDPARTPADSLLTHVEQLLHGEDLCCAAAVLSLAASALRELPDKRRHRRLTRTLLRLRGDSRAAQLHISLDGDNHESALEVIDASLAMTYAIGAPRRATRLLDQFTAVAGLSLDRELDIHIRLAQTDAKHAEMTARRGDSDRVELLRLGWEVLELAAQADDRLATLDCLTGLAPIGSGADPEEMRTGLRRRRADILRELLIISGSGRREDIRTEIRDLWDAILSERHLLSRRTLIQSLESELAVALVLPDLAPRSARQVAEELLAARHRGPGSGWRTHQAASMRWLVNMANT